MVPGPGSDLIDEIASWAAAVPRFRSFVAAYREKIRKKVRSARDADATAEVRSELLVARLLLADRRFELAFEAFPAGTAGPDFSVAFGSATFTLEVTHPRRPLDEGVLASTIVTKLRQLPPSVANVLVVVTDRDLGAPDAPGGPEDQRGATAPAPVDIGAAVRALRGRVDARDVAFLTSRGFPTPRAFYDRFLRLGAVIVMRETATGGEASAWLNASARIATPARAVRAAVTALSAHP